jgi:hypothetical protein
MNHQSYCLALGLTLIAFLPTWAADPREVRDLDPAKDKVEVRGIDAYPDSERAAWRVLHFVQKKVAVEVRLFNSASAQPAGEVYVFAADENLWGILTWIGNRGNDARATAPEPTKYPIRGITIEQRIPGSAYPASSHGGPAHRRELVRLRVPQTTVEGVFTIASFTQEVVLALPVETEAPPVAAR